MRLRVSLLSLAFALFLLLAGFFSVYYDFGPRSVWKTQEWTAEEREPVQATYAYLNHDAADLSFYAADERSHLADVLRLLDWAKGIFAVLLFVLIGSGTFVWRRRKRGMRNKGERQAKGEEESWMVFGRILCWGGAGGLGLVLLLALLAFLDFSWFWSGPFHELLFPQGNWMFPADSALITLFPEQFFRRFATRALLATAAYALLVLFAGLTLRKKRKS